MSTPIFEIDPSIPLVHLTVAFPFGGLEDPPGKEGLTRLTLRLMRRTPAGRSADATSESIDLLGGSLTGEVTRSMSALNGSVLTENATPFLELFSEMLDAPGLTESEFEQLKAESLAEWFEGLDNDRGLAFSAWESSVWADPRWGRPVQGTHESLSNLLLEDVREHAQKLVSTRPAIVAASGDLSAELVSEIERRFANYLSPVRAVQLLEDPEVPAGRRLLFVDKPERTQSQIVIGGLGAHPHDPDWIALHVANTIFGGTFTARLSQAVRVERGWSYGAYSYLPLDRHRSTFSLWTFPEATDTPACLRLELEMLEQFTEQGVTKSEFARARRYLTQSYAFHIDTASKRAAQVLDAELYGLPRDTPKTFLARIQALDLDQVNEAIRRRLSTKNLTVCVVGTHSAIGTAVEASIDRLTETRVVPYDRKG